VCRLVAAIRLSLPFEEATLRHVVTRQCESVSVYQVGPSVSRGFFPGCTRHRGKSTLGYIRELVQPTSLHQFQSEPRCSRLVQLDAPRQPPEAYQYAALVTWNQIPNVSYHERQVSCAIRWRLVALVNHRYLLSSTRVQKPEHLTP
jgi:hypothetical protein